MIKPSFFMDKAVVPMLTDVKELLPVSYPYWEHFIHFINQNFPEIKEEWTHSGKNYGWSFRLRSKKRVVMYFSPLESCLRVVFALGQKATDAVLAHPQIPFDIKKELLEAKVYVEGRGLRVEITNDNLIPVVEEIIKIKMDN